MTTSTDIITIYRVERFNVDWAEARFIKTLASTLRQNGGDSERAIFSGEYDEPRLAANYTGDLVSYFQYIIEDEYELSWADADYELKPVPDSEEYWTGKDGQLKSSIAYKFTLAIPENKLIRKAGI